MKYKKVVHTFNNISVIYLTFKEITTLCVVPSSMVDKVIDDKIASNLYEQFGHNAPIPLVDVSLNNDNKSRNFSAGDYLHMTSTATSLKVKSQEINENRFKKEVITILENEKIRAKHVILFNKDEEVLRIHCEVENIYNEPIILTSLPSIVVGGISPFIKDNDTDKLKIYEIINNWAGEGRLVYETASHYGLYDSWSHYGMRGHRISQVGSMPARNNLPFMAISDEINNVTWAISLYEAASWQIEAIHNTNSIYLCGGIADELVGHFKKVLNVNESFKTNEALIACVNSSLNDACYNLINANKMIVNESIYEESMPTIFNEYLLNMCNPTMEKLRPIIKSAKNLDVKYFVMDAGWYIKKINGPECLGDWDVSIERFPSSLKEFSNLVRENNMIPGIWFEFESVSTNSQIFKEHKDYLLTKDNEIIIHGDRCFLDFRKKEVIDYLTTKVIKLLKDNNIGYLKTDYNENIGLGIGNDNYAINLKNHIDCVIEFYKKIKREIPSIVIEMCSSGGMRHTPLLLSLADMCSFSDAHFTDDGLVIAMGLLRFINAKKLQIWVELKNDFSINKTYFALSKGMIGRICYSCDYDTLSLKQKELIKKANTFYKNVVHIIKDGKVIFNYDPSTNINNLINKSFIVIKEYKDEILIYYYAIKYQEKISKIDIKNYKVINSFTNTSFKVKDNNLIIDNYNDDYTILICHLKKEGKKDE